MYLHEVSKASFVLIQSTWSAENARLLLERLRGTHVIVHRTEPEHYYLYPKEAALEVFAKVAGNISVKDALDLHEWKATPAMDAFADAKTAPPRSVVVDEGRVVGFFDVTVPPAAPSRRAAGEQDTESRRPVPRSLIADFPEKVRSEEIVSLLVSLSAESPGQRPALPLALPPGSKVDVVVNPKRGFVLVETGEGTLVVDDAGPALPLQFKLKAIEVGIGRIAILAFSKGEPLGAITLAPVVVPAAERIETRRRSHEQPVGPLSVKQPDLSLVILEQADGKPTLTFRLTAQDPGLGLNLKKFGPLPLEMDPLQYFQDFFKDIEGMPLETAEQRTAAERRLADKGAHLFETLVPEDLRVLLWSLKDRIRSVVIQSEEPWIPWELCRLQAQKAGRTIPGPFVCEAFAVTRWLPEIGFKPGLSLKKLALVVPDDSGLPLATSERDYVLSLAGAGRQVERIPATFLDVSTALANGEYDGWHFTGHGGFRTPDPNRSVIVLENQDELTPEALSGEGKNLGLARPLVFLNACQIGRGAMSLTGIGGWSGQFLRAGAGAFVGAYWSVYDQPAHDFAKAFYDRLLGGVPIGTAAQEARKSIKPLGDPTWLAYTVFADPLATVT